MSRGCELLMTRNKTAVRLPKNTGRSRRGRQQVGKAGRDRKVGQGKDHHNFSSGLPLADLE